MKAQSHLPVVVDPSHATGRWELVAPMALGATACGADGLIIEVHNDPAHALCDGAQSVTPEQFGFQRVTLEELQGGDGKQNAEITTEILKGQARGAKRDIVLLNAGATLYAGKIANSIEDGIHMAKESIDSGRAYHVLEKLVEISNQ